MRGSFERNLRAFVVAAAYGCVGCAARDPVAVWRLQVENYVQTAGRGDPSVLRLASAQRASGGLRPGQIVLPAYDASVEGLPPHGRTRDVLGLLIGPAAERGQVWFVFVVAVVRYESNVWTPDRPPALIEDIRIAAFRTRRLLSPQWIVGEPDSEALAHYLQDRTWARGEQEPAWRTQQPFPAVDDRFVMRIEQGRLAVQEMHSGAHWAITLPVADDDAEARVH